MTNVQSVVTPSTNGAAPPVPKAKGKAKAKAKAIPVTANALKMTAEQACEAAFEYGSSLAGLDGTLTAAIRQFKDSETVMADMLEALNVGYLVRKMGYDKDKATEVVSLLKYNEKKQDDHHRTFEQQRVMDTVRVIWHRAQKMAGVVKAKSENQIEAEKTRAEKDAEHKNQLAQMEEAWAIVHPDNGKDVATVMARFVQAMQNYHNGHSANFVGDTGAAWRDWLAAAPIPTKK